MSFSTLSNSPDLLQLMWALSVFSGGTFLKSKLFNSLGAKAKNDTPSLAEEWDFETQTISGVNLGG